MKIVVLTKQVPDTWGDRSLELTLVLTVAAWILAKPAFLQPLASLNGKVTRQ